MQVVIFHQFAPTDAELLAQELEGISVTCHDIGYVIGDIHLVRISEPGLLLQFLLGCKELFLRSLSLVLS